MLPVRTRIGALEHLGTPTSEIVVQVNLGFSAKCCRLCFARGVVIQELNKLPIVPSGLFCQRFVLKQHIAAEKGNKKDLTYSVVSSREQ